MIVAGLSLYLDLSQKFGAWSDCCIIAVSSRLCKLRIQWVIIAGLSPGYTVLGVV